ncbi:galactose-binding domain-containing protein [Kribbella sp. CA-247076]|uniref:galactose-binding domain-containing protein n=1 Tax=Kribbella sp. CA-247076 TaxID=3239941 RepID=UPI003D8B258C
MKRAALLAVPLTLLLPAVAVASGNKHVEVSATPRPVEVVPLPCFPSGKLTLGMTNTGRKPTIADMRISGEPELTLSRRQFSSYLPVGQLVKAPLEVTVPRGTAPATYGVDLSVGREHLRVPISVQPVPRRDNVLLGEQAVASSTHGNMRLCGGVDGNADSAQWGASGWHDATKGVFPDTYGVDFVAPVTVGRVVLQTLDSARYPASVMGIRDFDVQVRSAGTWTTVGEVRSNVQGNVTVTFAPRPVDAVQLVSRDSNDHGYSRIVELEAYSS